MFIFIIKYTRVRSTRYRIASIIGGKFAPGLLSIADTTTGTTTYGDVVGDLDIDVKLDKQGQVRLNLFSHSADEYTAYLDNTQRNGGGITLQKEFNTWGDLFRSIFKRKKKKADE